MATWQVCTHQPDLNRAETFYVVTASAPHAREWAKRRGLKVESIHEVPWGEIPGGAELHTFSLHPEDPLTTIAESPLIRSPVWTIAMGILVGSLLSGCLLSIIANAMGGSARFGR